MIQRQCVGVEWSLSDLGARCSRSVLICFSDIDQSVDNSDIDYESLNGYRNGQEQGIFPWWIDAARCRLILVDRDIEHECGRQYALTYSMARQNLINSFSTSKRSLTFESVTIQGLEALACSLVDARVCTTVHPSGETLATWLLDIGFSQVMPTHSGSRSAGMLFDSIPRKNHPSDFHGVDELVCPLVEMVSQLAAPLDTDPMLTVVK